ncbi:hypothetical protein GCM10007415_32190 [Parapedobacter pyrenivorans]|uniref:DUF7674 domain-containing protein n=1 Tax=Parapedobacter pyrenivorans TaxID=1305674 RepID=A0A917HWT6_9SPHI|nr:hypothetical protein [Parapedobacter pyrenivorans]GGG94652.1 hypothetical protein GCM10007415_32190 [Parapedobacter pyrenivorans]
MDCETKITRTLREWIPAALTGTDPSDDYKALREAADLFLRKVVGDATERADALEALKVVNLLYTGGCLHDRNAIENEFLSVLASQESPGSLKAHIALFPKELRQAYLKTILEN